MLQTTKRVLSLLLALVMVIGLLPVIHGYAAGATEPPVMDADDASWDIPLSDLSVSCGDYETGGGSNEGPADLALDGNIATMWHTDWAGTTRTDHWFQFKVTGDYTVCGLRYLPRQTGNSNGTITRYEILVSDDGVTFRSVATGNWAENSSWKIAQFPGETVQYVRLVALDAVSDNDYVFASAAEIRLAYLPTEVSDADKTALNALIAECEQIQQGNYTGRSWQQLQSALEKARTISANPYASQTQVDEAYALLAQAKNGLKEKVEGEGMQIIFHLDSGRKYFSKDWTIALLNELSAAGYTHLQLAFGNNGLRFVLDDMSIEANGTTYDSDELKEGIDIGNYNYGALTGYYVDGAESLTEDEMDEIIAHGKAVGVEIIPHLNMPGHMSALLDAMEHVGINNPHFTGRVESDSSVDLTNAEAINFMHALVEKYAAYFAEQGVKYFHIGADEYANDAYNGSMGFPSMGSTLYQKFADFVNENARIVMDYGMTPRAWNDGIYYGSYTSQFDSSIEINYWSSGWGGYTLAKASTLDGKGHGLVNTNGDYYFILGKDDRFTPGSSSRHDPNEYDFCANFDMNRFMDGSVIAEPLGGMFCVWADYPGAETEQEVGANIRLVLRAMALGMEGLDLDGMYTGVVPGGFNEDGTINDVAHDHVYDQQITTDKYLATPGTCQQAATYYYSCACGRAHESETFTGELADHSYDAAGYCTVCGVIDTSRITIKKINVTVGETVTVTDETGNYENAVDRTNLNESIATVTVSGVGGPVEYTAGSAVTSLVSGNKYLLMNNRARKTVTNANASTNEAAAGNMVGLSLNGTTGNFSDNAVWILEEVSENVYTIQDINGKYMTIGSNFAGVIDAATNLDVVYNGSYWNIDKDGYYLNDAGNMQICASGWNGVEPDQTYDAATDEGSRWSIYNVIANEGEDSATTITITGVTVGETSVRVGDVVYEITVTDPVHTCVFDQKVATEAYQATDADCENAATYYFSCSCGKKGTETFESGEGLGHDYGEPTFVWAEDNTAKAVFTCERDEKHIHEETATVTSETAEGDCQTKATTTYTATVTFEDETYTDTKTVEGEIGDHTGDTNNDHKCDKCGKPVSECADADKDHKCDLCGKTLTECADADKNHKCDVCGKTLTECVDENKDYKCDICGAELEKPEDPTDPTDPEDPTDPTDPEQPEKPVIEDVIRLAGANRWETSLKVADEMKANLGLEKFDSIIIASGNDFADALAGSYLSTVKNAPILLGWGKGGKYVTLDEANIAYIKANLAEGGTVYILGGVNAVPELYETELKGYNVKRLGGANRFETNLLILEEAGVAEGSEVLVCTSTNFADSLSASATAKPILLVFNEYGKLYGKQPEFLSNLKNCTFTVIGGESAVSAKLFDAIKAYGTTTRLAGANRFETSVLVAQKYFKTPETAVLAYAWNYPDGLCGGSLAFSLKAPLILTMTKYEAKAVEYAKNAGIEIGLVLGGDTLISDDAVRAIFAMEKADEIVEK